MTTTTATQAKPLTAGDLLRLYSEGVRGELIRGELCEAMPTGHEHGRIVVNLVVEMKNFVKPRKLGTLTAPDSGVWLERDPDTVRAPDIAFFSAEKMPPATRVSGYSEVVPDLVVEVASPGDSFRETNDKALMWLGFGVRVALVVRPDTRSVDVHRPGRPVLALGQNDTLDDIDVLPGFTCAVKDIFDD